MSQEYQRIYFDLLEISPPNVILPLLPDMSSQDLNIKIKTLFRYTRRQIVTRKRKESLIYLYYIGEIIDKENISQKDSKLSKYYYTAAKRLFLIFEDNIEQIMRTQHVNIRMVERLKIDELNELIQWNSVLKGPNLEIETPNY